MKTKFDKIYVISVIYNVKRQDFVRRQMKELGLNFEFIYGIDFNDIKYNRFGENIEYPDIIKEYPVLDNNKAYGCTMSHYQAVLQAYVFGYRNVLIIEDDSCLIKDKELLEDYLNNIPDEADFINFTPRFLYIDEIPIFLRNLREHHLNDKYFNLDNECIYRSLIGSGMYAIMNRETMKTYLKNQKEKLYCADHVLEFFDKPNPKKIKRYTTRDAIVLDQYNVVKRNNDFNKVKLGLHCYTQCNIVKSYDNYFQEEFNNVSNINSKLMLTLT